MQHASWTLEDWERVAFSDESKFMLFKSDGRQYCWIKPGQALDPRFTQKNIKHDAGNLMVWGCITAKGMHQQNVISLKQLSCLILPFFPLFFTFFKSVS